MKSLTQQLEAENNAMEQRILALKEMMKKEKDERERLGGTRWKSSNASHENIAKMKDKVGNKAPKGPMKFKVLNDQPIDNYLKKKTMIQKQETPLVPCGQCEISSAKLECNECGELYCPTCYKQFHTKGALRKHTWKSLDQERKSAGKEPRELKSSRSARVDTGTAQTEDPLPSQQKLKKSGGLLLQGTYDEKESAASFQEALREWRSGRVDNSKNGMWVNPIKETRSCGTENPASSVQNNRTSPGNVKIGFEPSLTYAEKLALKKSRKDIDGYINYHTSGGRSVASDQGRTAASQSPRSHIESPRVQLTPNSRASSRSNSGSSQRAIVIPMGTRDAGPKSRPSKERTVHSGNGSEIISIQLVPSDEERQQIGVSTDSTSPLINEESYSDENNEKHKDSRRTLSQMGRLAIVELSFSDQNDEKRSRSDSSRCISASSHQSFPRSLRESPLQMSRNTSTPRNQFSPRPPKTVPSTTFVARQKMLMNRHSKQLNGSSTNVNDTANKILKSKNKNVWKPSINYSGLSNFFTAGVRSGQSDGERHDRVDDNMLNNGRLNGGKSVEGPKLSLKIQDIWRPESAISYSYSESRMYTPESDLLYLDDIMRNQTHSEPFVRPDSTPIPLPEVRMVVQPPAESPLGSLQNADSAAGHEGDNVHNNVRNAADRHLLPDDSVNASPRVSLGEYDFLIAPPPRSKGDDPTQLHRASTVTILGLSPQPIDIWNDDSEVELGASPKSCNSPRSLASPRSYVDERSYPSDKNLEDEEKENEQKTLKGLSSELEQKESETQTFRVHVDGRGTDWYDDSLSIEDDDAGSGLTSPGEPEDDYDGDHSCIEFENDKKEVKNLK